MTANLTNPNVAQMNNPSFKLAFFQQHKAALWMALTVAVSLLSADVRAIVWSALDGAVGGAHGANLTVTLRLAVMIGIMALSVLVALRAGLYNIGGEGQMIWGGLVAAYIGLNFSGSPTLVLLVSLLGGMLAGAAWALLAGWLYAVCAVPLLTGSLLLNYPAAHITSWLVNGPLRDMDAGLAQTERLSRELWLPNLPFGSVNLSVLIVLVLGLMVAYTLTRTRPGFRVSLLGHSPAFTRFVGMNTTRLTLGTMAASGALAGLGGALAVFDIQYRYIDGMLTAPMYAWSGIAAVLIVAARPMAVLPAAFLFACIETGGFGLERSMGIPREIALVMQACILLLVTAGALRQKGGK